MRLQEVIDLLNPELQQVETGIRGILESKDDNIANIYLHMQKAVGKRLRPVLFLACAKIKQEDLSNYIPVAVAIELLHSATLVHDDVIDQAVMRRGLPSINTHWGNKISVLTGDYLFAKSFTLLTDYGNLDLIQIIVQVVIEMLQGEIQQNLDAYNLEITEQEYFARVGKKTAYFLAACCKCGGIVCGANLHEQGLLFKFGYNLGIAYQLMDDLIDFCGDQEITGKEAGNDLKNGVITLPLIYALQNPSCRNDLKTYIKMEDHNNFELALKLIINSGGMEYTKKVAEKYINRALDITNEMSLNLSLDVLRSISYYIINRVY